MKIYRIIQVTDLNRATSEVTHEMEFSDEDLFQLAYNDLIAQRKIDQSLNLLSGAGGQNLSQLFSNWISAKLGLRYPVTVTAQWVSNRFTYQTNYSGYNAQTMDPSPKDYSQNVPGVTQINATPNPSTSGAPTEPANSDVWSTLSAWATMLSDLISYCLQKLMFSSPTKTSQWDASQPSNHRQPKSTSADQDNRPYLRHQQASLILGTID